MHIAHDQSNGFFGFAVFVGWAARKSVNAEMSPAGREIRRGGLFNLKRAHREIIVDSRAFNFLGFFGLYGGCGKCVVDSNNSDPNKNRARQHYNPHIEPDVECLVACGSAKQA